jgi:FkbM family methyltransferase
MFEKFRFAMRSNLTSAKIETLAQRTADLIKLARVIHLLGSSPSTSRLTLEQVFKLLKKSKSQLGQDFLALSMAGLDHKGFFVEFGATNGIDLSNTFLLEKEYGWSGILCEPARNWHDSLKRARGVSLDFRCVYSSTGKSVQFSEVSNGELSTISAFANKDGHSPSRRNLMKQYEVETVSLFDLLRQHQAPEFVDFLSIDTEGSEYEILKDFDFSSYLFGLIAVEHNYTKNQALIQKLLTSNGYQQIFPELSGFDDWFIKAP